MTKYLVIATVIDNEILGEPEVITTEQFQERVKNADEATGGNGGYKILAEIDGQYNAVSKTISDCGNKSCSYYRYYLVNYNPEFNGERFEHEAFHFAEEKCEYAQKRYIDFMENNSERPIPEYLERQANFWERRVAA